MYLIVRKIIKAYLYRFIKKNIWISTLIMKNKKDNLVLLSIVFLISITYSFSPFFSSYYSNQGLRTSSMPSNYQVNNFVKYQVEINLTLQQTSSGSDNFHFKLSRLDNRSPNSTNWGDCPPFQESELLYSKITNSNDAPFLQVDKFNNSYDLFNATLTNGESVSLSQKYNITLNDISFPNINPTDIKPYDDSNKIFDLYCNNSEKYYNRTDPDLIYASNNLTGITPSDNPVEKAEKICNWVSQYLNYDGTLPSEEKGASWAYNNKKGDCSEFSSLMITLLRIQNIPARKITGYVISNSGNFIPVPGQSWTFSTSPGSGETEFLGHAWVEYYVEGIGWLACDPTWQQVYPEYFNRIDAQRFNLNAGAWFSIPNFLNDSSEFPNPCIVYSLSSSFDSDYDVKVTVLKTDITQPDFLPLIILGVELLSIFALGALLRRRELNKMRLDYY
ncbi:MAG: hypothetical protein GF317_24220 [Candidatus Lokiarchaeota archaeon]|nr:hypothetical protein [Candidatus Lokiarchaeota archaeon]MBD3202480.1 hypothetical protein [Candidatus Lokiarchaeota archaeon]